MDDSIKKLIVSLITSANNLVQNGVGILGSSNCTDEASEESRRRLVMQLHCYVNNIRGHLNDLDEHLWLKLIEVSDSAPSAKLPKTICHQPRSALLQNNPNMFSNSRTVSDAAFRRSPEGSDLITSSSYQGNNQNNGHLFRCDNLIGESQQQRQKAFLHSSFSKSQKLQRRYDGYPYPKNAKILSASDIYEEWKVFDSRFPVGKDFQMLTKIKTEVIETPVDDVKDYTLALKETANDDDPQSESLSAPLDFPQVSKPSRLSLGPPRKPRSTQPNSVKAAEERQRALLSQPSLLAKPRVPGKGLGPDKKKNTTQDIPEVKPKMKIVKPVRNLRNTKTTEKASTSKGSEVQANKKKRKISKSDFDDEDDICLDKIRSKKKANTQ